MTSRQAIILAIGFVLCCVATGLVVYFMMKKDSNYQKDLYAQAYDRLTENNLELLQNNEDLSAKVNVLKDSIRQDSAKIVVLLSRHQDVEVQRNYWRKQAKLFKPAEVDSFLIARYQTELEDTIKKLVVIELIDYDHLDSLYVIVLAHNEVLQSTNKKLNGIIATKEEEANNLSVAYANLEEMLKLKNQEIQEAWDAADKAKRNAKLVGIAGSGFVVILLITLLIL